MVILYFACVVFIVWLASVRQAVLRRNPFGTTPYLFPLGIYVWGDGVIIGMFWTVLALVCWRFLDATWFGIGAALFWAVRSGGEVVYWLLEQYSAKPRNKPETLVGSRYIKGEAIWFVYQIVNQCILVCSLLVALYLYTLVQ